MRGFAEQNEFAGTGVILRSKANPGFGGEDLCGVSFMMNVSRGGCGMVRIFSYVTDFTYAINARFLNWTFSALADVEGINGRMYHVIENMSCLHRHGRPDAGRRLRSAKGEYER